MIRKTKISGGQTHICDVLMYGDDNGDYSEYYGSNKDDNAGSNANDDNKNYIIVIITSTFHLQHTSDICKPTKYLCFQ